MKKARREVTQKVLMISIFNLSLCKLLNMLNE